jgi:hypothetical protein
MTDMALRTCRVTCCDLSGVEHTVEVTADSLFEAVAQGLRAFAASDWGSDLERGNTLTLVVKQPEVEHRVRVRDFEAWLGVDRPDAERRRK